MSRRQSPSNSLFLIVGIILVAIVVSEMQGVGQVTRLPRVPEPTDVFTPSRLIRTPESTVLTRVPTPAVPTVPLTPPTLPSMPSKQEAEVEALAQANGLYELRDNEVALVKNTMGGSLPKAIQGLMVVNGYPITLQIDRPTSVVAIANGKNNEVLVPADNPDIEMPRDDPEWHG